MMNHAAFVESRAAQRIFVEALISLTLLLIAIRPTEASRFAQDVTPVATSVSATPQPPSPTPTALPPSLTSTSQPPSPTPAPLPGAAPGAWWQAETPAWLTALGFLLTSLITGLGWFVTSRQQRALAVEQQKLAQLQERMTRGRQLVVSAVEKLHALEEYIEFPLRISTCGDLQKIIERYEQEWRNEFGVRSGHADYYDRLVFGDDSENADPDNLCQLVSDMDKCLDDWVGALKDANIDRQSAGHYLEEAIGLTRIAIQRLNEIERRLLLDDRLIPEEL